MAGAESRLRSFRGRRRVIVLFRVCTPKADELDRIADDMTVTPASSQVHDGSAIACAAYGAAPCYSQYFIFVQPTTGDRVRLRFVGVSTRCDKHNE